jgi:hypothetical protein
MTEFCKNVIATGIESPPRVKRWFDTISQSPGPLHYLLETAFWVATVFRLAYFGLWLLPTHARIWGPWEHQVHLGFLRTWATVIRLIWEILLFLISGWIFSCVYPFFHSMLLKIINDRHVFIVECALGFLLFFVMLFELIFLSSLSILHGISFLWMVCRYALANASWIANRLFN